MLALAKLALLVPILGRYGWHRDELYFFAAGRHLAFGYVDFPPLTAVAARLVDATIGPSLVGLRLLSSCWRWLRRSRRGRSHASSAPVSGCRCWRPVHGSSRPSPSAEAVLFHPTFFDLAATALAMLGCARLVVRSEPRQWILLGLWGGIGLEAKYTIVVPLAAFLAGCALWRRDLLRCRQAGFGVLIAGGLLAPNVLWRSRTTGSRSTLRRPSAPRRLPTRRR